MRTLIIYSIVLIFIANNQLIAQSGNSVMDLYIEAISAVKKIEAKELEIVRIEFDILEKNEDSKVVFRNLSSQFTYQIAAYSDGRISDIDLEVYLKNEDNEFDLVDEVDTDDNIPYVVVEPEEEWGRYAIQVTADEFSGNSKAGRYLLIIAHEIPIYTDDSDEDDDIEEEEDDEEINDEKEGGSNYEYLIIMSDEMENERKKRRKYEPYGKKKLNARFKINNQLTVIQETSDRGDITYYVDGFESDEDNDVFTFRVTDQEGEASVFELRSLEDKIIQYPNYSEEERIIFWISNIYKK